VQEETRAPEGKYWYLYFAAVLQQSPD